MLSEVGPATPEATGSAGGSTPLSLGTAKAKAKVQAPAKEEEAFGFRIPSLREVYWGLARIQEAGSFQAWTRTAGLLVSIDFSHCSEVRN